MSSISDESAIITLEVELKSNVSGLEGEQGGGAPPDSFFSDVAGGQFDETVMKAITESVQDSIEDVMEEQGVDIDDLKTMTNLAKDLDSKGMANIKNAGRNPEGFIEKNIIGALTKAGPYGALTAAIITTLLATPEFVTQVVQMFGVKGGILNQDYRFTQEEFLSQEFDRKVQFRRLTGDDPLITVTTNGFVTPLDPDFAGNSLVDANLARTARIGLRDSAYGYIHGI